MKDCKYPVGNGIKAPEFATSKNGKTMDVSLDHNGEINISASTENRSAKFKAPNVSQDVPSEGRSQYM